LGSSWIPYPSEGRVRLDSGKTIFIAPFLEVLRVDPGVVPTVIAASVLEDVLNS
jgi:hypothetical protein